jgi:DNA-binding CsgD family transcriptional regulator/cell division protein FtsB
LLIQGYYNGLNVIEKRNGNWQLRNIIKGFNPTSRFFEFTKDGSILMNHEYKGVYKIDLDQNLTKVVNYQILKSVPKALKSAITTYEGDILYASDKGIFKYNNTSKNFYKDSTLSNYFLKDDSYVSGKLLSDKKSNTLWGFTSKSLVHFTPGKFNKVSKVTKISLDANARKFLAGFENVLHLNDDYYLFGSSEGYLILDLKKITQTDFTVEINTIEKGTLNVSAIPVSLKNNAIFKNKENNISFKYSVPVFNKYAEVSYQYQLKGMYDKWTNWSKESEASFKNLPHGSYTFNVKARIGNTVSKNSATFSFVIEKPWYLSNEILIVYAFLFIILFLVIHNLYKSYYTKQKKKLMDKKQQEFSLTQLENEKEIMKLKNEKLQNEIDSKTRELSASTMSIIKKNELLNTIKNELGDVKNESSIKPVIKIINKNLSNTSDWEMFQEAFNNADSDFLKKVKTAHPNLTPNDLRLCAYLRLNLSSKEIAPLLNISARSVEIKRYRLRKKMDLPHEKSLVEYILEL